jgi:aspartate/methionine/tyrosine aminotransferase
MAYTILVQVDAPGGDMKPRSSLAQALPRSGIREVMDLARQMDDVIVLVVGEPSFNTPAHIIDAAANAAHAGTTKYTPNAGLPGIRAAVAERYTKKFGRPVAPAEVLVTAGAVNALAALVAAIAEEGDEILIPDPGWPNLVAMIELARAVPVRYPMLPERGYVPDVADVEARVTPRTKAIIINNPSNPTGAVFPEATVRALVDLARKHDLWLIADEIYEDLVFAGVHVPAARFDDERVITVSGASKSYAMTGWRIGWAITNPELVALCGKIQEALVSCPSAVSQAAAEAAVRGPQDAVEEMRQAYLRRRDLVRDILEPAGLLPTLPQGAFYALVDLRRAGIPSRDLSRMLLEEERVAAAPGSTFGEVAEGMVRISLATADDDLAEGCRRIVRFAERHGALPVAELAVAQA